MPGSGAKRVPWFLIAVLAAQACNDGVTTPAPSATPASFELPDVRGQWSGTYDDASKNCLDEHIRVDLWQSGHAVSGTFTTQCWGSPFVVDLHGELIGSWSPVILDVTLDTNDQRIGHFSGLASSTAITVSRRPNTPPELRLSR